MSAVDQASREGWIRQAVRRFEAPLMLYASRIVGDVDAARDVVQDTFLRLCAQDRQQIGITEQGLLVIWPAM